MNSTHFYQDKPIFGFDIGHDTIKVMQIEGINIKERIVSGYGVTKFEPDAVVDGVIVKPEELAATTLNLFQKKMVGDITTRRVVMAVPSSRTFTRTLTLPKLEDKDIAEAVRLEAEQYIPVPVDELYLDYSVISHSDKGIELLAVAVPKKIVDSYVELARILDLDIVAIETTISAGSRLFVQAEQSDVPTVLIDLGTRSADITIYDDALLVTSTVPHGGDSFSEAISKSLKVSPEEAHIIKTKYGLGVSKKQKEITDSLKPVLEQMLKEVRRMIRYYEERSGTERKINQVVTMGGGANMPGLSEYLTNHLRLAARMCDPWQHLDFTGLQPPNTAEKSMYITVAGLALTVPREIFS